MTRAAKVDVFLSYNRADAEAAEALRDTLRARGLTVFFDRDYLAPGRRWQQVLETSLATCGSIAICIGRRGLGEWQQREKQMALAREAADGGFTVIPVLLPGADDPGLDFLSIFSWADLRHGLDRAADVEALVVAIRGDALVAPERPDPRAGICPYRGLKPFREEDAAFFMGREDTSAHLTAKVLASPFTMVVGASGCGKSSVAFAGLLPRLRAGAGGHGWEIAALTPGARPLHQLMAALSPPPEGLSRAQRLASLQRDVDALRDSNVGLAAFVDDILAAQPGTDRLLLLVDQFEELFTQCESDDDRDRFVDLLLAGTTPADGPLHVVLTLRGDFYGRALADRPLADRLDGAVLNVGPMTRNELRRTIVEPAARVGLSFADDLPAHILDDVGSEPGHLPLLEFLLTELWRRRQPDGTMTGAAYGAIGGVKRAIAARAEAELDKLSGVERETARRVLVSLVTPGEGREDTRARAVVPAGDEDAQSVIRHFANARLLTTDHDDALNVDTVEVSHEALIREWDTLKGWVDQDREFLRTLKRLRDAMAAWAAEQTDKDSRLLPLGRPLEEARELLTRDDALIDDVRPFIQQSIAADEASREADRRREKEENLRRLAEAHKLAAAERSKRKATIAGLIAALVLLAVSGLLGWRAMEQERIAEANKNEAQRQTAIAETNFNEAVSQAEVAKKRADDILRQESLRLAGLARQQTKNGDAVTGMLLALEALPDARLPDRPIVSEATGALIEAMLEQRERVVLRGHGDRVNSAQLSRDGTKVLTASSDETARIWDAVTGKELVPPLHHDNEVTGANFSREETRVLTETRDNAIHVWDAATGGKLSGLRPKKSVKWAVFGHDGTHVLTQSIKGPVRIWDVAKGALLLSLGNDDVVGHWTFPSPDRRRVVTYGWKDVGARTWDATMGGQLFVLPGQRPLAFSEDGKQLLTADSKANTARIWDALNGNELAVLRGHERRIETGSFSSDAGKVITGSRDQTARIWDGRTGQGLQVLPGNSGRGTPLFDFAIFNRDATRALTATAKTVRLWNADDGIRITQLPCDRNARFMGDGRGIVARCEDGSLRFWRAKDGKEVRVFRAGTPIRSFVFSEDESRFVTTSRKTAHIWDLVSAADGVQRHVGPTDVTAMFSPDGQRVLGKSIFGVRTLALATLKLSKLTDDPIYPAKMLSASMTPNALRLVSSSEDDGSVWLWDGKSGETILTLRGPNDWFNDFGPRVAAFSADGSRLVTAFESRDAHLRDGLSGEIIATLQGHKDDIISATFSADGSKLVTSSWDGTMRLWNAENGAHLKVLQASGDGSEALALSPDGTRILEGLSDWTVRLRDAKSGQEMTVFRGHEQSVVAAAFSPDGSLVATGSRDNTARIWDAASGEERVVIRSHSGSINSVAFSPDGSRLVSASRDKTVAIWPVFRSVEDLEDLVAEARSRLPRQLTDEQRRRFSLQPAEAR